jgi:hypothetical protein
MKYLFVSVLILVSCCFWSCETPKAQANDIKKAHPVNNKEAYAFLETFLNSNASIQRQLSKALKPTKQDLAAIFVDTAIQSKAWDYVEYLFEKEKFNIRLRKEHQDLEVWSAAVKDFENGVGDSIEFPSDFMTIIPFLNEDLTFHRFKFKVKGYSSGVSYDGLTQVNGRWVIVPKAWKVVE